MWVRDGICAWRTLCDVWFYVLFDCEDRRKGNLLLWGQAWPRTTKWRRGKMNADQGSRCMQSVVVKMKWIMWDVWLYHYFFCERHDCVRQLWKDLYSCKAPSCTMPSKPTSIHGTILMGSVVEELFLKAMDDHRVVFGRWPHDIVILGCRVKSWHWITWANLATPT